MSQSKLTVQNRVDAEIAARFISERVGIPVASRTLLAWARRNRVPHTRLVGRVVFDLVELSAWVSAGHVGIDVSPAEPGSELPRMQA